MKFTCNKKEICEAVTNLLPAVSTKSTLSALEGIYLEAAGASLTLSSFNLELGIIKTLSINSEASGNIILNASLFSNIINKMPDGLLSFSTNENLLMIISCKTVEFTILGMSGAEFPEIPKLAEERSFTLPHHLLKNMISQTLFSISQVDTNPILTGSLFDIKDSILRVVSVDGVRLAMRKERVSVLEDFSFVVPGKTLAEISKLLSKLAVDMDKGNEKNKDSDADYVEEKVFLSVANRHISFSIAGYTFVSRLLEGKFLDYENAIPKERQTTVIIEKKEFLDSINRASIIINERAKSPVKCTFEGSTISLFCETSLGKINDSIKAEITGTEVTIGFNNKYMQDALRASECDRLKMEINGAISPIIILPPDGDDFLFLVLPVRLKG